MKQRIVAATARRAAPEFARRSSACTFITSGVPQYAVSRYRTTAISIHTQTTASHKHKMSPNKLRFHDFRMREILPVSLKQESLLSLIPTVSLFNQDSSKDAQKIRKI